MPLIKRIVAILLLSCSTAFAQTDEEATPQQPPSQPFSIVEEYDAVILVDVHCERYSYQKLYFYRNKRIIADRWVNEDFFWVHVDDKFVIVWRELGWPNPSDRAVITKNLHQMTVEENPTPGGNEWWMMQNIMTNLEQPPDEAP